jgi:hypothetical protein
LVTPVPLSPLLLLCCAYGVGSIKISLQAMPYSYPKTTFEPNISIKDVKNVLPKDF